MTDEPAPALLHCPFCGSSAIIQPSTDNRRRGYWIQCELLGCYAKIGYSADDSGEWGDFYTKQAAADFWNTRAN